jgi:hypothetical protein
MKVYSTPGTLKDRDLTRFVEQSYVKLAEHLSLKAECTISVDLAKKTFTPATGYGCIGEQAKTTVEFTLNEKYIAYVFIGIGHTTVNRDS